MNMDSAHPDESKMSTMSVVPLFVGRQGIYDRNLSISAYELLHRDGVTDEADFVSGEEATARVLSNAFIDLGLDVVTGGKPAFINLTEELLSSEMAHLFPPDRIVVEVLEDVRATDEVLERVGALKKAGYRIALDDFVFDESLRALVELADIVKIDVLELGMEKVTKEVELLREFDVELLAEKIETHDEFHTCKELGFDFFQGYFLCRPQVVKAKRSRQSSLGIIRLLACLNDAECSTEELDEIISNDAKLSYRLMTYINSAVFSLSGRVTSVQHALTLLGRKTVRSWANLVVLSSARGESDEVLTTALMRARICEILARENQEIAPDEFFTVGLFSILDALLGMPMEEVIDGLPLADAVSRALLSRDGIHGEILDLAIAYERAPLDDISSEDFDSYQIRGAYLDAIEWVSKVMP